jgi:hypothetical protein
MARVGERELRLSQDLIALQAAYNTCIKHRDELVKELELLKKLYESKMIESDKRAEKLQRLLNRATKFEAVETTKRRTAK